MNRSGYTDDYDDAKPGVRVRNLRYGEVWRITTAREASGFIPGLRARTPQAS